MRIPATLRDYASHCILIQLTGTLSIANLHSNKAPWLSLPHGSSVVIPTARFARFPLELQPQSDTPPTTLLVTIYHVKRLQQLLSSPHCAVIPHSIATWELTHIASFMSI